MMHTTRKHAQRPRGVITVLAALMMAALVGMVAFAVDYGSLVKIRTDLQRAADAAALAAVQDLIRKPNGTQDLDQARTTVRTYAGDNLGDDSFQVPTGDIQIGRYDPATIYSTVTLLNTGTFDTVRVTLRRDGVSNPKAPLFFARVWGMQNTAITATATAVLQKAEIMRPGSEILPFATPVALWNSLQPGDTWSGYGDGKLKDEDGNDVPGDWGTLDIGELDNSTSELNDQILHGLRQKDLDALFEDDRIEQDTHINSEDPVWMQGDSGLSSGLKSSVTAMHGSLKLIPIYDTLGGHLAGNNVEFHVIGWGVVTLVDSQWQGQTNTRVILKKSHLFKGQLRPIGSLSAGSGFIEGAYTSPVLIE